MNLRVIDENSYNELLHRLDEIAEKVSQPKVNDLASEWLDIEDVCRTLRTTKRSVQTYRDKGLLPFYRVEGKILYKRSDVVAMLNNSRVIK
jgi:hypothetical protein